MPTLLRILIRTIAVVLLLIALGALFLTLRSYRISDSFLYDRPGWNVWLETADGDFRLEIALPIGYQTSPDRLGYSHSTDKVDGSGVFPWRIPGSTVHFQWHSFALVTGERWGDDHYALFLPGWFIVTVVCLLLLFVVYRMLRRPRLADAACRRCGYDLRASPERCPECGTIVTLQRSTPPQV